MALIAQGPVSLAGKPAVGASDLLRSSSSGFYGASLNVPTQLRLGMRSKSSSGSRSRQGLVSSFNVRAALWPFEKPEPELPRDLERKARGRRVHYTKFRRLRETQKPIRLAFEKPLIQIEKQIALVKKLAEKYGVDASETIAPLMARYQKVRMKTFLNLHPIDRLHIARHPNRPTFLDHILNITDKFMELHGDRAGYDDPAVVSGLGSIDGQTYMFIGQQKGRNTKESIKRNFGMPTPHGYRKALRMMRYADHQGFPIVTFVDTPGAFADLKSEYLGQAEAIAMNLREMFGLKVPVISVILGEGGSGGALAIAVCNKMLMLENSVFFVASPEACAAILWKSAKAIPKAARKLRITARELVKQEIADEVIPEPLGGAHTDPALTSQYIKKYIKKSMEELSKMSPEELLSQRYQKFRKMGNVDEGKTEKPVYTPQSIEQLKMDTDQEFSKAVKAIGFKGTLDSLRQEFKESTSHVQRAVILKKIEEVEHEINQRLPDAPNYSTLKSKRDMLSDMYRTEKNARLQQELDKRFREILDDPQTQKVFNGFKTMIKKSGVKGPKEVDPKVKNLYFHAKMKLQYQLAMVLTSMGLMSNSVAVEKGKLLAKKAFSDEFEGAVDEVVDDITKATEEIIKKTPTLQRKIELLNMELMKVEKNPSSVSEKEIEALEQDINRSLTEALTSQRREETSASPETEEEPMKKVLEETSA
uniref:acetyl-CoA carboxytransferase n=1 Tax=Monsonia emarginata TaxID=28966 RepID=A0A286SC35_9ROSI|nr:acetyl-CoA carboxylase subunit alpha [Monsonia emarginata]